MKDSSNRLGKFESKASQVALLALFSLSCSAQALFGSGEIILDSGEKIISIKIGKNQATNREFMSQVRKLERAVSDLQRKIYDLPEKEQTLYKCTTEAFGTPYYGSGETEALAMSISMAECAEKHHPMFCEEDDTTCKQLR